MMPTAEGKWLYRNIGSIFSYDRVDSASAVQHCERQGQQCPLPTEPRTDDNPGRLVEQLCDPLLFAAQTKNMRNGERKRGRELSLIHI